MTLEFGDYYNPDPIAPFNPGTDFASSTPFSLAADYSPSSFTPDLTGLGDLSGGGAPMLDMQTMLADMRFTPPPPETPVVETPADRKTNAEADYIKSLNDRVNRPFYMEPAVWLGMGSILFSFLQADRAAASQKELYERQARDRKDELELSRSHSLELARLQGDYALRNTALNNSRGGGAVNRGRYTDFN